MQEFFPNSDTSQEPQVSKSKSKGFILNQVGSCLMSLGRLSEAPPFYERCNAVTLSRKDWHNASRSYWNLADLYIYLGKLATSAEASNKALLLARRANDRKNERTALTRQAYIAHMQGNIEKAAKAFQQAEGLEWTINPNNRYLYSHRGIQHADHLLRTTDIDYARRVTEANLKICSRYGWLAELSLCYRVLGDVDADAGKSQSAHEHYNTALKIARSTSAQYALIETLLARGRWTARLGEVEAARSDLDEALNYSTTSGYRIYEVDIRVGLAWAHLKDGNSSAARTEAEQAKCMSAEMGYHWGQVDGEEVLAVLDLDKKVV
jgi:tetratricopeptide (TPR) repeat protein